MLGISKFEFVWALAILLRRLAGIETGEERNREEGEMAKKSREEGENEMLGVRRDG